MAQKKAHEVDRWLARPDPATRLVLVYGPDRGLVSERARRFAVATGLPLDDPFAVVRLDAPELERDPGRLEDEARTVPMFGGERLIWIANAGSQRALAEEVRRLAEASPADARILIEAGDLKKGAALRAAAEGGAAAMALPCYADDARALDALIDEEMAKAGLSIALEARQALKTSLGGDRLASRSELAKLALYCLGSTRVELADIRAALGDVSAVSTDDAVDAVLAGRTAAADTALDRHRAAGGQTFLALAAAMRQFQALQLMRGQMAREGKSAAAVVASARPPVFFARKALVEDALRRWSEADLARALERLREAVLETRRRPDLANAVTHRTLLALARHASR